MYYFLLLLINPFIESYDLYRHEPLVKFTSKGFENFLSITACFTDTPYVVDLADKSKMLPRNLLKGNTFLINGNNKHSSHLDLKHLSCNEIDELILFYKSVNDVVVTIPEYRPSNTLVELLKISHLLKNESVNTIIAKILLRSHDNRWLQLKARPYFSSKMLQNQWSFLAEYYKSSGRHHTDIEPFDILIEIGKTKDKEFLQKYFNSEFHRILQYFYHFYMNFNKKYELYKGNLEADKISNVVCSTYKQARSKLTASVFIASRAVIPFSESLGIFKNGFIDNFNDINFIDKHYLYLMDELKIVARWWVPKNAERYCASPNAERLVWIHPRENGVFCDIAVGMKASESTGQMHDLKKLFNIDFSIVDIIFINNYEILLSLKADKKYYVVSYNLDTNKMYLQPQIKGLYFFGIFEKENTKDLPIKTYTVCANEPLEQESQSNIRELLSSGVLQGSAEHWESYARLYSLKFYNIE